MKKKSWPNFEELDAKIVSEQKKSYRTPASRKRSAWRKWKLTKMIVFSKKTDCLLDLRILPGHWHQWFCRELCRTTYRCFSKWWYSGIRFEMGRNSVIDDTNPIWWHLGRIVHIKNTRVWGTRDRIGIVWPGDSSEKSLTWLSQIEDNCEKKDRAESTNYEFWSLKRKLWDKRRRQESGDKTAWTKHSRRLLAIENGRKVF